MYCFIFQQLMPSVRHLAEVITGISNEFEIRCIVAGVLETIHLFYLMPVFSRLVISIAGAVFSRCLRPCFPADSLSSSAAACMEGFLLSAHSSAGTGHLW